MIVQELFAKLGLQLDTGSWAKGEQFLSGVKGAFVGILATLGLNSISNMIEGVVELGGRLNDQAQKTGVAVEALQYYGYVAKLNSSSAEGITHAITKLNRNLGELAQNGKGPAGDALKKLGINFQDAGFKAKSSDEKLQLIAESLAKLPDGPEKVAIAMDLLGRSGAELIPTLNDLGKNGKQLKAEFDEFGGALSGEQTAALDEYGDSIDKSKAMLGGLKNQIVAGMLPVLAELLQGFMNWIKSNKEFIQSAITAAVNVLVIAFQTLGSVIEFISDAWDFFNEHSELGKALLVGIALVIMSSVVPALAAMALGWIEALAPIIAVIALGAALYLVISDIWEGITEGKGVAADVWRFIVRKLDDAVDSIKGLGDDIVNALGSAWESVKTAAGNAFDWIIARAKEVAAEAWQAIKDIPVIGQIAQLGEAIVGGPSVMDTVNRLATGQASGLYNNPDVFGSSPVANLANGTNVEVTNHIVVNPSTGMTETDIAKKVAEYGKNSMRDAFEASRGGRR